MVRYKLSPSDVPEVFSESTPRLVERAAGLVELAADTWLVTGRHPVHVLVGAVYLAWLSLNPCKTRLGIPLARFCRMAKVCMPGKAALRVLELKEVLCQLARELPWLRGAPVDSRTVPTLTGDILKHRILLMRKAMQNFESELPPAAGGPHTCPPTAEGAPHSQPRRALVEGDEAPIRSGKSPPPAMQMPASDWPSWEASRFNTECPQSQPPPSGNPNEEAVTYDLDSQDGGGDPVPENGWAKRHLFVPPCTRNPPKKRRMENVGPAVTGYEEISDSEIEGYLRTPQEMDEFEELQRRLMSTSDS